MRTFIYHISLGMTLIMGFFFVMGLISFLICRFILNDYETTKDFFPVYFTFGTLITCGAITYIIENFEKIMEKFFSLIRKNQHS